MPTPISERIEAAVALLTPRPNERLLEIGCGTGQAIQAMLARQPTAHIVAIDRSEKAVARARIVNRAAIEAGRVAISIGDIEHGPVAPGGFDRVFAIRLNSFWTRPGVALPHVAASLGPEGELWLIYDGPADKVLSPVVASFQAFGLSDIRTESTVGTVRAFAIIGRLAGARG